MASKKIARVKSLSPDELLLRAVRARRQFKALVRSVIANLQWLEDVDEDEQLSANVKKNVQLLTRKKGKKSLLTLQQKSILCKPAEYRTEQEKLLLNRIIGGLKCFRKYPEHVKMQLAGVTYFVYYPSGRVIVRQNHEAHALYFIVTGEVAVSITTFDPVLKEKVTLNVGTMIAGSMFGEVSLLHDIPRTATITTSTPCELLCLKKADFDIVLKASVKKQWDEIQKAMSRFTYFDGWDEVAVRECCIYSKIKPYIRDQTILGDGVGVPSSTYFILKGSCRVIEHLLVEVFFDVQGKKSYKLYEKEKAVEREGRTILDERKESLTSITSERKVSAFTNLAEPTPATPVPAARKSSMANKSRSSIKQQRQSQVSSSEPERKLSVNTTRSSTQGRPSVSKSKSDTRKSVSSDQKSSARDTPVHKPLLALRKSDTELSDVKLPSNVETHFMQVCIFTETACFGLGESMRHRRVVAMSDYVECLLIPRYWLMQRNKGNLWTRIQQYLNTQIPTSEKVFREFLSQRKWFRYRKDLTLELFGKPPVTMYYNIPYSIRINEDIDLD